MLEGPLGSSVGLHLLGKAEALQFFSYLFNFEEWAGRDQLRADTGVDRQIVNSPVGWHSELLLDPSISDLMIDGTTGVCAQQLRIAWLKV